MVIQKPCQTYLDYWPVNFERLATFKSEIALGYLFGYLAPEPFWARAAAELVTGHVHLLYILTSFWVLRALKSWSKHFLQPFFNLFCSFYGFFSDFTAEINKKVWKWTKKRWTCLCLLLKPGRHAKAGRLPEGVPWNCLFSVDFFDLLADYGRVSS